jgi:hypothetical protein
MYLDTNLSWQRPIYLRHIWMRMDMPLPLGHANVCVCGRLSRNYLLSISHSIRLSLSTL